MVKIVFAFCNTTRKNNNLSRKFFNSNYTFRNGSRNIDMVKQMLHREDSAKVGKRQFDSGD